MAKAASFRWSVMSPSDFVKFRLTEFDQQTAAQVSELNPGGAWPVYVAAVDDATGDVIASTTVVPEVSAGRPNDRTAYAAAKMGAASLADYVEAEGYEIAAAPRLVKAPLPNEYRA